MAQLGMSQEVIDRIKQLYGYTDEQIAAFSPKQRKARLMELEAMKYRLIAEVVEAENCACRHRKGQKYVFLDGGALLPSESTVRLLCAWAIAPMVPFFYLFYDRLSEGLDPSGTVFEYIKCLDTGAKCGGWGQVTFKMRWEKSSEPEARG